MQLCNRDKGTINPKLEHILLITMLTIKILFTINPFAPQLPVTAREDPRPFYPL